MITVKIKEDKKTIIEWNKLIAEFMGVSHAAVDGNLYYYVNGDSYDTLEYHTSWDWLMPVVNKCCILNNNTGITIFCQNDFYLNDIWAVFKSCVKFITSLNKQK